jgi:hypothetical protein
VKSIGVLLAASALCADMPPYEFRKERAEYVSTFLKAGAIGAEIGVDEGSFSYFVLLSRSPAKLFLIDPWQYGLDAPIEKDPTPEKQQKRDADYEAVCRVFSPYDNVTVLRMKSEDAVGRFEDGYFDYVYIDGEHSYAAVMRDLTNYFPKVKVGGYIIGDDYGWTGIAPAVQDFVSGHQNECLFLDNPYEGRTAGQYVIRKLK